MPKTLRVLFLEDTPEDAELSIATLEDVGYICDWERVETREDFVDRLESSEYDLLLSDYNLPTFDGLSAAKLFVELGLDIPFILVSGTLGEEAAVESLKAGATDFVLKTKLFRLASVVERALSEKEQIRHHKRAENERRVISEIINGVIATRDLDEFLHLVHRLIGQIVYAENCFVMLHDKTSDLIYFEFWADKHDERPAPRPMGRGFSSYVLRTGKSLLLTDEKRKEIIDKGEAEQLGTFSPSWVGVPLRTPSRTIGVMVLQHYDNENAYSQRDLEFLSSVGDQIALAIERKWAEVALIESEESYRDLVENAIDIIYTHDLKGSYTSVNKAGEQITGYTPEEALKMNLADIVAPEYLEKARQMVAAKLAGKDVTAYELEIVAKDGHRVSVEVNTRIIYENDEPVGVQGIARDITDRKSSEMALRESEEKFRQLAANVTDVFYITSPDMGTMLYVSPAYAQIWGRTTASLYANPNEWADAILPEQRSDVFDQFSRLATEPTVTAEFQIERPDGTRRWISSRGFQVKDAEGDVIRITGIAGDITERKLAVERIVQSENQLAEAQSVTHIGSWNWDLHDNTLIWSDEHFRIYGLAPGEIDPVFEPLVERYIYKEDRDLVKKTVAHSRRTLEPFDFHYRVIRPDGHVRTLHSRGHVDADEHGNAARMYGTAQDVTERQVAEAALKEAEEKYRSIFENAVEGIFQTTVDGRAISVNPATARILGYESPAELIADRTDIARQHYVDPETRRELQRILKNDGVVIGFESEVFRKDGTKIWTQENMREVRDADGTLLYYEGSIEDITARKQLEDQFRQAQKMEAVGILAGGIAHDFNNLLTAINGYSDLTLKKMGADEPLRHHIQEIRTAGDRAAALTTQLLAFSRKQVLTPRVHNLNSLITEIDKMLRRLIRESIELRIVLDPELGNIKADPGQIEQVIVNLAVNARDAMPDGGTLTIETRNVELEDNYVDIHPTAVAGAFIQMTVTDTGEGMDKAVQERIFEPFFTTKDLGKGTGLGLSTVHGIIKQSGGNIRVYSEVGHGTTFKIYLPSVAEEVQKARWHDETQKDLSGTETILLVEDDEIVRKLVREILTGNGYRVLEADNGGSALSICKTEAERIHLLLSDVIMPGMSGPVLKEQVVKIHPDIKVLFMSGYTDDSIANTGMLESGAAFIEKPFSPDALAQKIREILTS